MNAVPLSPERRFFAELLEQRTGQRLTPARSWRIDTTLRPILRKRGFSDLGALAGHMTRVTDEALRVQVVEAMLNNESSFFRDMSVFQALNTEGLACLQARRTDERRLRIWSAGCSTGQEAYSLALLFAEQASRWVDWTIEITATDISSAAIARARAGRYSQFEIQRGLPVRTMLSCFRQEGDEWIVDSKIRRAVSFGLHNVLDAPPGRYDLVLCRNVLMYFASEPRSRVFDRLASALVPDGLLMLGAGETVIGQTNRFHASPAVRGFYASVRDDSSR